MQLVLARIEVSPARTREFHKALADLFTQFRAEPGCIYYSVAIEDEAEGKVIVIEKWADEAARAAHSANPALHSAIKPFVGDFRVDLEVIELPDQAL